LQTPTGLQLQPGNSGMSIADLAIHLTPSGSFTNAFYGNFTNGYPDRLTSQQPTNGVRATIKHGNNFWSQIPDSQYAPTLEGLSRHCHSFDDLRRSNYVLSPYGADFISTRRKCKNCHRKLRSLIRYAKEPFSHLSRSTKERRAIRPK
jgi:hypothetical protein